MRIGLFILLAVLIVLTLAGIGMQVWQLVR